jgi:excisionase family DNA binding protein
MEGGSALSAARGPLRVREVAALCGVEQKTVHNWVARGMIAHFRTPGRHVRFLPAEVADFVAKGRVGARDGVGEPRAARGGGGTPNVVVVVLPGARFLTSGGLGGALRSLRHELPKSRFVWLGKAPSAIPDDVEHAASAKDLRILLAGKAGKRGLRARDGHRRDPERR